MTQVDDVITLATLLTPRPHHPVNARHRSSLRSDLGTRWSDGVNMENMHDKAYGYVMPDSMALLRERCSDDLPTITRMRRPRTRRYQAHGDRIDDFVGMERYRRGHSRDDHFWSDTVKPKLRRKGTLTLVVNTASNCGQQQSELEWRGAAALALTDVLEAGGYRVELIAANGTSHYGAGSRMLDCAVILKGAGEPMVESAMALATNLGIWRAAYISHMDTYPWDVGCGHGSPRESSITGDITVPQRMRTQEEAERFVDETMRQFLDFDGEE